MHGTVDTLLVGGPIEGNLEIWPTEFILETGWIHAYLEATSMRGRLRCTAAGLWLDFASIMRVFSGTCLKLKLKTDYSSIRSPLPSGQGFVFEEGLYVSISALLQVHLFT